MQQQKKNMKNKEPSKSASGPKEEDAKEQKATRNRKRNLE